MTTASLSLDLDNAWSYLMTRGDDRWREFPSYLDVVVPRAVELFDELGLSLTFFVVGTDAEREPALVGELSAAGHEVENHSHRHEPWLHRYDASELEQELDRAEAAIEAATGRRPVGFRGPGYSLSGPLLRSLARRGYAYDASTLPTWIGPLARAWYFRTAGLDRTQRRQRARLFGSFGDAAWPLRPHRFDGAGDLVELPVTVMPLLRAPMHLSYVLFLEGVSPGLARAWFRAGLALCVRLGVEPSILLHPLDLIGADDLHGSSLAFFPGMGLDGVTKRRLVVDCLRELADRFDTVTMGEHAERLGDRPLPARALPER